MHGTLNWDLSETQRWLLAGGLWAAVLLLVTGSAIEGRIVRWWAKRLRRHRLSRLLSRLAGFGPRRLRWRPGR